MTHFAGARNLRLGCSVWSDLQKWLSTVVCFGSELPLGSSNDHIAQNVTIILSCWDFRQGRQTCGRAQQTTHLIMPANHRRPSHALLYCPFSD